MSLTKIGSIGINTGIAFAGVTTITTLNGSDAVLSVGGTVNFVSDVSIGGTVSIAGTLTYEDVTNVDAVGLITARDGINVGSGITLSVDGDIFATGVTTATKFVGDGSELTGVASTENIRTNTNATFLQNINVSGTSTIGGNVFADADLFMVDKLRHTGDTDTAIRFPIADTITAETGGSERVRISSNGTVYPIGNGQSFNSATLPNGHNVQINTTSSSHGFSVTRYSGSYAAYGLNIGRSKNDTIGTNSSVANGDDLGHITWYGADGSDFNQSAAISAQVDGTPSDGTDMPGRLIFKTSADGSGTPAERFRIDSSGDATISNGNLIIGTAGKGIDFSAQSSPASGMTSELLDHYEEGEWTPELSFGNTATGQSYSAQKGRYTRIGNRCFVTSYLLLTNKGSSTGTARIGGLPFTIANITNFYQHGSLWVNNWTGGNTVPTGYGELGTTTFRIERQNASSSSGVFSADQSNFNNNSDLMLSFHYLVN